MVVVNNSFRAFLWAFIAAITVLCQWTTSQAATAQGKSTRVWLSDLPEQDVVVGEGKFGKQGWSGFASMPIETHGLTSHHSLAMCPDAHVEYILGKKYGSFRGTATMSDASGPLGSGRPVVFRVFGDGKLLWESFSMYGSVHRQPCLINIVGVNILRLEVAYRPGSEGIGRHPHAVWVDPYVAAEMPAADVMFLFEPKQFRHHETIDNLVLRSHDMLNKGQYEGLEKIASQYRDSDEVCDSQPMLYWFYVSVSFPLLAKGERWDRVFENLERWMKAQPDSITPLVALANAHLKHAWDSRQVDDDGEEKFNERIAGGRKYLDRALEKNASDGELYSTLIAYELYENSSRDKIFEYFKGGKKFPLHYYRIYTDLAEKLLTDPKSKAGELEPVAANLRQMIGGEWGDEIYFRMANQALDRFGEKFFAETYFKYEDLKPGLLITVHKHPEDPHLVNCACMLACLGGDKDLAATLFAQLDVDTVNLFTWKTMVRFEHWQRKFDPNVERGEESQIVEPEVGKIVALAYFADNYLLIAGDPPGARLWDLRKDHLLKFLGATLQVRRIATDGNAAVVALCYGSVDYLSRGASDFTLHDYPHGDLHVLKGHEGDVSSVTLRDVDHFATAANDATARLWQRGDFKHPRVLKHPEPVFDIALSPDGKLAATASLTGGLWLWDADTGKAKGKPLVQRSPGSLQHPCFLRFLPSSDHFVRASIDGMLQVWDVATRKKQEFRSSQEQVASFDLSRDGRWIALGRAGGRVDIYSVAPLALAHSFYGHHSRCQAVAFSPDNKALASGSFDGDVKIWPMSDLKVLANAARQNESPANK